MKYKLNVAMDIRAYGSITVETDDLEKLKDIVTAEYVRDNFEPHGSNDDLDYSHPYDIVITDIEDEDGNEYDVPEDVESVPDPWWS